MRVMIDDDRMNGVASHIVIDLIYFTVDRYLLDRSVFQNLYLIFTVPHIQKLGIISR